jgi:hypothetical protein
VLELVAGVQVRVVERMGLSHFPNNFQPTLAQGSQGAGMTFALGSERGVVSRSPRRELAAQVGPEMHGVAQRLVALAAQIFIHEGRFYTNGGGHSKWLLSEVNAYLLIPPDEYQGPDSEPYSYEGKTVTHKGKTYRLGPKTLFVASDPTVAEWRHLCRVLYASGCTYTEFVGNRFDPESVNGREARFKELAECDARPMPRTQEEMRRLLAEQSAPTNQPQQIDFAL